MAHNPMRGARHQKKQKTQDKKKKEKNKKKKKKPTNHTNTAKKKKKKKKKKTKLTCDKILAMLSSFRTIENQDLVGHSQGRVLAGKT